MSHIFKAGRPARGNRLDLWKFEAHGDASLRIDPRLLATTGAAHWPTSHIFLLVHNPSKCLGYPMNFKKNLDLSQSESLWALTTSNPRDVIGPYRCLNHVFHQVQGADYWTTFIDDSTEDWTTFCRPMDHFLKACSRFTGHILQSDEPYKEWPKACN